MPVVFISNLLLLPFDTREVFGRVPGESARQIGVGLAPLATGAKGECRHVQRQYSQAFESMDRMFDCRLHTLYSSLRLTLSPILHALPSY